MEDFENFKVFSLVPSLRGSLFSVTRTNCLKSLFSFVPHSQASSVREDLPVSGQHLLPDDLPHDLRVDAEQLGDGGVRVVEAIQQNLRHLSLLLSYQPERSSLSIGECEYC